MKRVLLTGGTGFVGANLARWLLREGYELHLLVRARYNPWRIADIQDALRLHVVDMSDAPALAALLAAIHPEWVFHLAAHGAYSWQRDVQQIVQTNVVGTVNLLHACLEQGCEAFIHTGSSSEYGFKDHPPAEDTWLEPNSYYAAAKASATLFCRHAAQEHDAHVVTLRLYSAFGPYEEPGRLLPTLVRRGLAGDLPPLVNPDIARDYVYVDDVCAACVLAAQRTDLPRGAVYNVGTGIQTSLREAVAVARRVLSIAAEPQWGTMPDRQWDTTVWVADNTAIRRDLGWQPRYSFEQGLRALIDWQRAQDIETGERG